MLNQGSVMLHIHYLYVESRFSYASYPLLLFVSTTSVLNVGSVALLIRESGSVAVRIHESGSVVTSYQQRLLIHNFFFFFFISTTSFSSFSSFSSHPQLLCLVFYYFL